jgi:peptide/nickel transport system permease protein
MINYFFRRLLLTIPVLIGITLLTFLVMHLTPGNPADTMTDMNLKVSAQAKSRLAELYGLNKPWYTQYGLWLGRVSRLDFGNSFRDERPAIRKIAERLPATLLLNLLSMGLILSIAIPLGVFAALHQKKLFDTVTTVGVYIGFSVPTFWLALMLMILFGLKLGWLPISGLHSVNYDDLTIPGKMLDMARHLVLPVFVSAFTGLAGMTRYTRSSMIDVLKQDYIRMAYAKGLPRHRILFRHALKNALLPVITIFGLSLPGLIGGGFIFETIFAYPGMGRLGYDAIMARDYPVVMAVGVIVAFLTLAGNLIADMSYALADPRIKYK